MIAAGDADLLGERYAFSGRSPQGWIKLTTAGVKRRIGRARVAANPMIGMGAESFVTELKAYRDWEIKWWREVVQNSVDAGATRIDLRAHKVENTWIVSCSDNGSGMSEETLVSKFLYLGATTKAAISGAAGGFGVAKKLILLPWLLWEVITGNVHVVGHGVNYFRADDYSSEASGFFEDIGGRPAQETHRGTVVRVTMPEDRHTDNVAALAFLEKCYLPNTRFTINGKVVRANLKAKDLVASAPGKADVFFTKKKGLTTYHLLIRSNGLYMFEEWISDIEGVLIAEITAPSTEILTSNRDGFRDTEVRRMIKGLADRIAVDRKSALRKKLGIIRKKYTGSGKFKSQVQAEFRAEAIEATGELTPGKNGRLRGDALVRLNGSLEGMRVQLENRSLDLRGPGDVPVHGQEFLNGVAGINAGSSSVIMSSTEFKGVDHVEDALKQLVWQPDFYVYNNIERFKVPKKFFPETMTPSVFKLAKVWTEICRYVLIQLGCSLPYGVGWIFEEEVGAAYQGSTDEETWFRSRGEHWLLLNPYKNTHERRAVWKASKQSDLRWLYAAAVHEATHMADGISYHNESFAAALTRNIAATADGFKHIRKIANAVKMTGGISLTSGPGPI